MKLISKRLTYANVMSSIAVFLILGGATAFAAKKIGSNEIKGNSITTGKIKKEAVSAAKVKKNAITTAKIANGAVTGAKVNLGSLGTVPSATNAAHATNADNATNATNFSRFNTSGVKTAAAGSDVQLGTVGPFSIVGRCKDLGGGSYEATTLISTSQAGSFLYSLGGKFVNGNFDPGNQVEIGEDVTSTTPEWYDYYDDDETGWTAASPTGSVVLVGNATNGVHVFGGACAFVTSWLNRA